MQSLQIAAIVALVVALIIAIVVWTIVGIKYKKILRQKKIDGLIKKISKKAKDRGNESEGDQEELSALVEMGHHAPWDVNDL
uniref:Protein Vpu n=1 Tax=Human immunodeficiency virus type 1 TaxID=11676 RepID=Q5U8G1_HV1|nr:vpu protein [Human immunodeficiency virus 1]